MLLAGRFKAKTLCLVYTSVLCISHCMPAAAQKSVAPIGKWIAHTSYGDGKQLVKAGNLIYVATDLGLFSYDSQEGEIRAYSRVDGFSDVKIRKIAYSEEYKSLFVAYGGGVIDIYQSGKVRSLKDLPNSALPGEKEVNGFTFSGERCYISTSVGVLEYNMKRNIFGGTYANIDPDCQQKSYNDVALLNGRIYAANNRGVIVADLSNAMLEDCRVWQRSTSGQECTALKSFQGRLYGAFKLSDSTQQLRYFDGMQWQDLPAIPQNYLNISISGTRLAAVGMRETVIIDGSHAIQNSPSNGQTDVAFGNDGSMFMSLRVYTFAMKRGNDFQFIRPSGPNSNMATTLYYYNNEMYVGYGTISDLGAPSYTNYGIDVLRDYGWSNLSFPDQASQVRDMIHLRVDTLTKKKYISALTGGIIVLSADDKFEALYDENTLPLQPAKGNQFGGQSFDSYDNLWLAAYRNPYALWVKPRSGPWARFAFPGTNRNEFTNLVVDYWDQIWLQSPREGVIVFNYNKTLRDSTDDQFKILSTSKGAGNLPSGQVNCIAIDRVGQIWLGTDDGVAVFAETSQIFRGPFNATRPYILSGKDSGYLLSGQQIRSIAVDGANRKWIGTRNGLFLVSENGDKILANFNMANSPLPDDNIVALCVHGKTGEVFIATEKGLMTYRGTATRGGDVNQNVLVFPNPVRPGYSGPIAISGLVRDAIVKISDVNGRLVYETIAQGGQAIWDGKNFKGEPAASGVYVIHAANDDGSQTTTAKVLIVR